ncbi:hypothetical protein D3C85_1096640 [compost metagenome]
MPGPEPVLHELVQGAQVDVRKELAAEVTDGQPEVCRLSSQAFVLRHLGEQLARATHLVVLARVVPEHLQGQLAPPGFVDQGAQLAIQHTLVDRDEEVGEVSFQVEGRLRPVLAGAAHLGFQPLGGVQRAAPGDAGAAVGDEGGLDATADVVVQQVVDDAIAEGGGPHFARLRPGDHETDGAARPVGAGQQLFVQLEEVDLHGLFEPERAGGVPLAAPAVVVGLDQVLEGEGCNT